MTASIERLLAGEGHLDVHFQPVVSLDTGSVVAAEALLRCSLDGSPVSPPVVVHAAREAGRMIELGRAILDRAVASAARWDALDGRSVELMVNVDASELEAADFFATVIETLTRHDCAPDRLILEITETALISDSEVARGNLADVRAAGIGVALDDFGTGFASLSHLRSVPLTVVKLDRTFIDGVDHDGLDLEIVRSVIKLAHAVGLSTVAEGVERESQWAALHGLGCDAWQGYLRSPAVDAETFARDLADERATTRRSNTDVEVAEDSFVLRRIAADRWAHLGGHGRGEGWAGILDVDETDTPSLVEALDSGWLEITHEQERWLFGAYHSRHAVLVRVDSDTVVVFGAPNGQRLPSETASYWHRRADALASAIAGVSAAKRLADELELSEALQALVAAPSTTLDEAMRHVIGRVASSLSCELGVIYLPSDRRIAFADASVALDRDEELFAALDRIAASRSVAQCHQDAAETPFPLPGADRLGVRSWMTIPVAPRFGGIIVCAHTARQPRGFTTLCQRLGRRLAEAAELIIDAAIDRERLDARADHAATLARFDALTGALNRRGWDDALGALRVDDVYTVAIVDANDLKWVNDHDGHAAGDRLIVQIKEILEGLSRAQDVVARLGGDEFGLLLPGVDQSVARTVHERLCDVFALERLRSPLLSVAVGMASSAPGDEPGDVVARADAAMYRAKRAGRSAPASRRTDRPAS